MSCGVLHLHVLLHIHALLTFICLYDDNDHSVFRFLLSECASAVRQGSMLHQPTTRQPISQRFLQLNTCLAKSTRFSFFKYSSLYVLPIDLIIIIYIYIIYYYWVYGVGMEQRTHVCHFSRPSISGNWNRTGGRIFIRPFIDYPDIKMMILISEGVLNALLCVTFESC